MKIVSASEMRAIDRTTTERFGVPSLTLMENAGTAVSDFVLSDYPGAERIGVICGKGNNGGDGFVAVRKLADAGRAVRVLLLCDPGDLRGDAAAMFERMKVPAVIVRDEAGLKGRAVGEIFASDLIVDAVLGTGFHPPMSGLFAAAIAKMNASACPIVAVDIPSGADADAMRSQGTIAHADAVVTFTAPRPAHIFGELTGGPTLIVPIGSPQEAVVSQLALQLSTPPDFQELLAPRATDANKGNYGHVLVIGGSLGKAGSVAMSGFAALRAGAGLSTVATPKSVLDTVAVFHPELMTEPLPETQEQTISLRACGEVVKKMIERKSVIAIGPGISRNPETVEFVRTLLRPGEVPENVAIVVDADALNAFEGTADQLNGRGRTIVITPHPGEMSRLTGMSIAEIQANRLEIARRFAREHHLIVVLKGHRTLTAAPDGTVWVNPSGNPGMATGGTGDILTGIVAGLIAQHPTKAFEASVLGVYLHGAAGDLARDAVGENSLVATDLVRFLPAAFKAAKSEAQDFRLYA